MPPKAKVKKSLVFKNNTPVSREPLWKGPEVDGISQSLLSRFIVCRDRFRVHVIEGLRPIQSFNHRMEYGNMWHICEEAFADGKDWEAPLLKYCKELCEKYRPQQEQVNHWYYVCKMQFPIYIEFWKGHKDMLDRTPLLQEEVFKIPYILPSGREVFLRGKFDSVDLVKPKGQKAAIYLQENKAKGDIDEIALQRQLKFDLQTMMYLICLHLLQRENIPDDENWHPPIEGVRYNVIRRPLSGGKGTIKQKNGETTSEFYSRLQQYIIDEPAHYFMRWNSKIFPGDYLKFRQSFLDPCLEQLCDWYACQTGGQVNPHSSSYQNFRTPFGIYNVLAEGGHTDVDEYLENGSETGLERFTELFPELE